MPASKWFPAVEVELFGILAWQACHPIDRFLSGWLNGTMGGFACYGWESLTHGTWDLFWVCITPAARRRGLGGALVGEAVRVATAEGG